MSRIPFVLAVSDRRGGDARDWADWCAALAEAGVDSLQVRERELADRELLDRIEAARAAFPPPNLLLVNRRFDLALAGGADGVHLPSDGLPARAVRASVGAGFRVGRSTHHREEIEALAAEGAVDYAVFGPIFATPSKRDILEPRGLDELAAACAAGLPVIAIGGVDSANAGEVLAAGAAGIAAIRAVAEPVSARALVAAAHAARARA